MFWLRKQAEDGDVKHLNEDNFATEILNNPPMSGVYYLKPSWGNRVIRTEVRNYCSLTDSVIAPAMGIKESSNE